VEGFFSEQYAGQQIDENSVYYIGPKRNSTTQKEA
jgi:hypothetical protein